MKAIRFDTTDYINGDTWNARMARERVEALDIESLQGDWQYAVPEPKICCVECDDQIGDLCQRCWEADLDE